MELPSIWLQDNLFKDKKKDSKRMQMINQDLIVHNLEI